MNQCGGRILARDAYIIENLYTCDTAACANTCMCLLISFMEKTAFGIVGATNDQHQIQVSRLECKHPFVRACVITSVMIYA